MSEKKRVTFYGHFTGWSSYPTVCRALAQYLAQHVDLRVCNLRGGEYEGQIAGTPVEEEERASIVRRAQVIAQGGIPERPEADGTALVFGFPEWLWAIPLHRRTVGYHVGDVDNIPAPWVMAMNTASAVLTPSPWVSRVFSANGVVQPIRIVPHGVADAFVPFAAEPPQSKFTFLHFSAVQVPARKGTMELLEAFGNVAERIDAYLDIRSAVPGALRAYVGTKPWKERVSITLDDPGPPAEMAKKLCSAHCVVAPSRAEGFGMICDEALACAVPVVATTCTGHEGRLTETTPGLRVVPHGGMEPCGPVGKAPSISVHKLEDALVEMRFAYQDFSREARRNAVRFFYAHQWEAVLSSSPLLDTLIA